MIIRSHLNCQCQLHHTKSLEGTSFHNAYTQKGNNNTKRLAYTALVRPILEYVEVCWGPYREGQVSALSGVQKGAAKFGNNINESGWETLAQRRLVARLCALSKAYTGRRAWKALGDSLLKPCYLSRDDHNLKIRIRKQRTDVGKYSFVNRTIQAGTNYLQTY